MNHPIKNRCITLVRTINYALMPKIALFASGSGSNVENIAHYFSNDPTVEISVVFTNTTNAGVIARCKTLNLPLFYFNRSAFLSGKLLAVIKALDIDLIVLAGFLLKIPEDMVRAFANKIINIHPALLPKFGGKGMYGMHVHRAVKEQNEVETGITIHFVNEHYDEGAIIHQAKVGLNGSESPEEIAEKVHALEYEHYPKIIEKIIRQHG